MDEQVKDLMETAVDAVEENKEAVVETAKNTLEVIAKVDNGTLVKTGAIGGAIAIGTWFLGTKGVRFAKEKIADFKEKKAEKEAAKAAKKEKKDKQETK